MTTENSTIIINGSKEAIENINKEIRNQANSQTQVTERRNLDGDTATWIVIATFASQALPHILSFIKDYVSVKGVKKVKVGDFEVENPTPEIIAQFLEIVKARSK